MADFGSKVNRLMQPFHYRRVYYQLLQVLPDVGRDKLEKWNGGGCRWFLPSSSAWLKLIGRRMELENPFASVLDFATSGMNTLRAECHDVSDGKRDSAVSNRMVIF